MILPLFHLELVLSRAGGVDFLTYFTFPTLSRQTNSMALKRRQIAIIVSVIVSTVM